MKKLIMCCTAALLFSAPAFAAKWIDIGTAPNSDGSFMEASVDGDSIKLVNGVASFTFRMHHAQVGKTVFASFDTQTRIDCTKSTITFGVSTPMVSDADGKVVAPADTEEQTMPIEQGTSFGYLKNLVCP